MIIQTLAKAGSINPPKFLPDNVAYLTIMGSAAYGVNNDDSDQDMYGFCLPPKHIIFPHTAGEIPQFGKQRDQFNSWSEHHVKHPDDPNKKYDFTVYSIVKYFDLVMQNNPNMIDSLFTPLNCVVHTTSIGQHVREHRKEFLHKGAWHKFKGYAYSQMGKIDSKSNASNPARAESIALYGYDVKFAYHIVRLLNEVEQIMVEGDLDLLRSREQLKSIRRGEWSLDQLKNWFAERESALSGVYLNSKLPHSPNEGRVKQILLECLEMHYGRLDNLVAKTGGNEAIIMDLQALIARHGG